MTSVADIDAALRALDLAPDLGPGGERTVRIPCDARGQVGVVLHVRERSLTMRAFLMRRPDRGHIAVYERLLHRNLFEGPWCFCLDALGDVWARCHVPLSAVDEGLLDGYLGSLSMLIDEMFPVLVAEGFGGPPPDGARPPQGLSAG